VPRFDTCSTILKVESEMIVLLLAIAVSIPLIGASNELRQVHVVSRHGFRYPSIENDNIVSSLEDTLTPLGEKQLYELGEWLKKRYSGKIGRWYNPHLFRLESSEADAAVVSANALAEGLLDKSSRDPYNENMLPFSRPNVPVYTTASKDDVFFRAYDKCKTYNSTLATLSSSEEFLHFGQRYGKLLTKLAQKKEFMAYKDADTNGIHLLDVWNVYDIFAFAYAECGSSNRNTTACRSVTTVNHIPTMLTHHEWGELQDLTHSVERLKFSTDVAGTLLGGPLLAKITERMGLEELDFEDRDSEDAQLFVYSGHYETILSLLAALGEPPVDKAIPATGSALVFELYDRISTPDPDYFIKVYYKHGENDTAVQLRNVCHDCTLDVLVTYVDNQIASKNWCQECGNDSADICRVPASSVASQPHDILTTVEASTTSLRSNDDVFSVVSMFIGLATGFIGALLLQCGLFRRRLRKAEIEIAPESTSVAVTALPPLPSQVELT
jgi:Histidine phosphatase superfamily (branch 2)